MKHFIVAAFAAAVLVGCASITQGTSQVLAFRIQPKEAICILTGVDDGELGSVSGTSNTIQVGKDKDDIVVQCRAPGYQQKTTRVVSRATTAGVTGVLLDFGITDMITGAMYAYPGDVTIVMDRDTAEAAKSVVGNMPVSAPAPAPLTLPAK
jgi:hypothetical protein